MIIVNFFYSFSSDANSSKSIKNKSYGITYQLLIFEIKLQLNFMFYLIITAYYVKKKTTPFFEIKKLVLIQVHTYRKRDKHFGMNNNFFY